MSPKQRQHFPFGCIAQAWTVCVQFPAYIFNPKMQTSHFINLTVSLMSGLARLSFCVHIVVFLYLYAMILTRYFSVFTVDQLWCQHHWYCAEVACCGTYYEYQYGGPDERVGHDGVCGRWCDTEHH